MYASQPVTNTPYPSYASPSVNYSMQPAQMRSQAMYPSITQNRHQTSHMLSSGSDDLQNNIINNQLKQIFEILETFVKHDMAYSPNKHRKPDSKESQISQKLDELLLKYEEMRQKIDENTTKIDELVSNNHEFKKNFDEKAQRILDEIYKRSSGEAKVLVLNKTSKKSAGDDEFFETFC